MLHVLDIWESSGAGSIDAGIDFGDDSRQPRIGAPCDRSVTILRSSRHGQDATRHNTTRHARAWSDTRHALDSISQSTGDGAPAPCNCVPPPPSPSAGSGVLTGFRPSHSPLGRGRRGPDGPSVDQASTKFLLKIYGIFFPLTRTDHSKKKYQKIE